MIRCACGNNVILNDNWNGVPQYLDPDTNHPHQCFFNPMFRKDIWLDYETEPIDFDNERLCIKHGLLLINNRCPKPECDNIGWIRRSYYNKLNKG